MQLSNEPGVQAIPLVLFTHLSCGIVTSMCTSPPLIAGPTTAPIMFIPVCMLQHMTRAYYRVMVLEDCKQRSPKWRAAQSGCNRGAMHPQKRAPKHPGVQPGRDAPHASATLVLP